MIDKEILDAVIPVPMLEEAKDEKVAELKEEGFVVTNFHSRRRTNQKTVNDLCTCFVYTILTPNYGDSIV